MSRDNNYQPPTSIDRLGDFPERLLNFFKERGVVTCEQAFDAVSRCLRAEELPAGIEKDDLEEVRRRIDQVLPPHVITHLTEEASRLWTNERPLGVLPPEASTESSDDNDSSSSEKEDS